MLKLKINIGNSSMTLCLPLLPLLTRNIIGGSSGIWTGFDESLALSNFDKAIGIQLTQLIYFIIMAAAVQEFLELPSVTGLQELKKTDLLEVAKSLNLVKVNASYRKAQIAKLIAQDLYDESLFTSEDLAPFVDVDGDPQPKPSSETE